MKSFELSFERFLDTAKFFKMSIKMLIILQFQYILPYISKMSIKMLIILQFQYILPYISKAAFTYPLYAVGL
jgi:hypothetical protein